ncbi:hypothetical protein Taro_015724 [Colocasia esculenta]|uniref:Uncharacterized protein n=1 Tax=Colocasia esculenta TaxID=4460 RepID=A0A843UQT2_COLES|nr:hypothetical protein [Colocasia esculenta]
MMSDRQGFFTSARRRCDRVMSRCGDDGFLTPPPSAGQKEADVVSEGELSAEEEEAEVPMDDVVMESELQSVCVTAKDSDWVMRKVVSPGLLRLPRWKNLSPLYGMEAGSLSLGRMHGFLKRRGRGQFKWERLARVSRRPGRRRRMVGVLGSSFPGADHEDLVCEPGDMGV